MSKHYIHPSVRLLDGTNSKIWYLIWLSSRHEILKRIDGSSLDISFNSGIDFTFSNLPDEFYVGDELVNKYKYAERIAEMNLQYMNFPYYIFEIQGSCLFRDILFNINKVAMWATSNRFLFSILDPDSVFNEENYPISEEYKDIPEWEEQFDKYMEAIKKDQVVDHNRIEMPYSITSKFHIGINKKTIMDFLKFLKFHAPFFYSIYGIQFNRELNIADEDIKDGSISAAITQYINKSKNNWSEGVSNVGDTYVVESKMGLILYSQFIRQADTTIKGLYDEIIHDNPKEFSHKVFKGGTILETHYVADYDKIKSTLSTRLCAFAMSSGNDPCSWSYFLNNFLPEDLTPEKLMDLLPCRFEDGRLINCKFHDDVKFRNEGKEISNCPCPLVTLSMDDALKKQERDNNKIGDAFYNLTNHIINDGLVYTANYHAWTSDLVIKSSKSLAYIPHFDEEINTILKYIDHCISKFGSKIDEYGWYEDKYKKYELNGDNTCMMKGLAIDKIREFMESNGHDRYIISFGGDIFIKNARAVIPVDGTKFNVNINGTYSVFTSGNTSKRGNHIETGKEGITTVIVNWKDSKIDNILVDAYTTKYHAEDYECCMDIEYSLGKAEVHVYSFGIDGNMNQITYCASPFFNPDQIKVRDNMIKSFNNYFRPDLTDSSKKYDMGNSTEEVVNGVVNENIQGIITSDALVFPMRTNDLGTLWEVGYAIGKGHDIISYDEVNDKYFITIINEHCDEDFSDGQYLFDCSNKLEAVSMGTASAIIPSDNIYYQLKGCKDNIMLSVNYTHVEENENFEYEIIRRDLNERDN